MKLPRSPSNVTHSLTLPAATFLLVFLTCCLLPAPVSAQTGNSPNVETVLYQFTGGVDGGNPWAGVVFDQAGNLYGTTLSGGNFGHGTVYKLSPSGGTWTETVLY